MLDVGAGGPLSNPELRGDLRIGAAGGDQPRDLELPRSQRMPRLVLGDAAAGLPRERTRAIDERPASQTKGRLADIGDQGRGLDDAPAAPQAAGQVEAGPQPLPGPALRLPARDRPFERRPRDPHRAVR